MTNCANSQKILDELNLNQEKVRATKPTFKRAHYQAAINWVTLYKYGSDAADFDKICNFLEVFYHLCEAEDYEMASKVYLLQLPLPSVSEKLYATLEIWGYYNILIGDFNKLLGKINPSTDVFLNSLLGNYYLIIGEASIALQHYEAAIRISASEKYLEMEENILIGIGNCYNFWGDYEKAHLYYMDGLISASSKGNERVIQQVRGGLGSVHAATGQYKMALTEYTAQLKIARKLGNRLAESDSLSSLADIYHYLGDNSLALKCIEESLLIASDINYKKGKIRLFNQLGLIHIEGNRINQARDCFNQCIVISREIRFLLGEAEAMANLGISYIDEDENSIALEMLETTLEKFRKINNIIGEGKVLFALARFYQRVGDTTSAFNSCNLAEKLAEQHNIPSLLEIVIRFKENLEKDELFRVLNHLAKQIAEKESIIESQQKLLQAYKEYQ